MTERAWEPTDRRTRMNAAITAALQAAEEVIAEHSQRAMVAGARLQEVADIVERMTGEGDHV